MKILYLYPKKYYDTKMSMGRVLYGQAVARQPGVELKFWGPGWPGYNSDLSLARNIMASGETFDVVWFYKADQIIGAGEFPGCRVVAFNEANAPQTLDEIRAAGANVVIFHHENDMPRWKFLEEEGAKLVHILHGAPREFFNLPESARPWDVMLSGVVSQDTYPLRSRFATLIRSQQMPGYIRPYPGHRLKTEEACRVQYKLYASALQSTKVSLCCTSKFKYALAKIVESLAAGCLVVSDMPGDWAFKQTLGKHIIEVPDNTSDADLIKIVTDTAAGWSLARAAAGRFEALNHFSTDSYAEKFLQAVE